MTQHQGLALGSIWTPRKRQRGLGSHSQRAEGHLPVLSLGGPSLPSVAWCQLKGRTLQGDMTSTPYTGPSLAGRTPFGRPATSLSLPSGVAACPQPTISWQPQEQGSKCHFLRKATGVAMLLASFLVTEEPVTPLTR